MLPTGFVSGKEAVLSDVPGEAFGRLVVTPRRPGCLSGSEGISGNPRSPFLKGISLHRAMAVPDAYICPLLMAGRVRFQFS